MGIKSLTKLIKNKSPDAIETSQYHKLSGKRVAIDTSLYIYQSLMNVRHNGKSLTNNDDKVTSHISGIFYKNVNLLSMNITPVYIFDGKPPVEKSEVIRMRQEKAKVAKTKLENSVSDETCSESTKDKLEKKSIRLTKTHIDDIKQLLNLMGIEYLHMDGEGEALASELCRIGYVDYVMTEDMDTLPFGCPRLIRNCLDRTQKRKDLISIIDLDKVLEDLKLDYDKFTELFKGQIIEQNQTQFRCPKSNYVNETDPFSMRTPQINKKFKALYTKGNILEDGTITPLII
jgi:flap endonuclease-1